MVKGLLTVALTSTFMLSAEPAHSISPAYCSPQPQNLITEAQNGICSGTDNNCFYTDANGDGICDNCSSPAGVCGRGYIDANGDGICDNYGTQAGNGAGGGGNYVDANGDGICDNYGTQAGNGTGGGYHHGGGNGCGTGSSHGGGHRGGRSR